MIKCLNNKDYDGLKLILEKKIHPDSELDYRRLGTFLMSICNVFNKNNAEYIELLLKHGANPNIETFKGSPACFSLAICANPNCLKTHEYVLELLLKYGANVNHKTTGLSHSVTPLHYAVMTCNQNIVEICLKYEGQIKMQKIFLGKPLEQFKHGGHYFTNTPQGIKIIKLLEYGCDYVFKKEEK